MEAKAIARYIRISPRKVRLLADLVRGEAIEDAEKQLRFSVKDSRVVLLKLLKSAVSNAEGKKMKREALYVKRITVDGGAALKRWRPRAFGRAAPIRKRTSHITIVLAEKQQ